MTKATPPGTLPVPDDSPVAWPPEQRCHARMSHEYSPRSLAVDGLEPAPTPSAGRCGASHSHDEVVDLYRSADVLVLCSLDALSIPAKFYEYVAAGPPVLAISQANLAKMVGVSRQTLNTMLGSLQRQGLIELGFKSIRVLDAIGLVAFVAGPARRKPIARSRPDRREAVPKSRRDGPARR